MNLVGFLSLAIKSDLDDSQHSLLYTVKFSSISLDRSSFRAVLHIATFRAFRNSFLICEIVLYYIRLYPTKKLLLRQEQELT